MKPNLSPEALLALSAYIDDALDAPDKAALEQRLATDEQLRRELDSLRQTVALLQQLSPIKAPRDFTLDPAVYGTSAPANVVTVSAWRRIGLAVAALLVLVCGVGSGLVLFVPNAADAPDEAANAVMASPTASPQTVVEGDETLDDMTAVAQSQPASPVVIATARAMPSEIIAKGTATPPPTELTAFGEPDANVMMPNPTATVAIGTGEDAATANTGTGEAGIAANEPPPATLTVAAVPQAAEDSTQGDSSITTGADTTAPSDDFSDEGILPPVIDSTITDAESSEAAPETDQDTVILEEAPDTSASETESSATEVAAVAATGTVDRSYPERLVGVNLYSAGQNMLRAASQVAINLRQILVGHVSN